LAIVPSSGRSSSLVYGRDAQAFNSMYLLLGFFKDGKKTFTGYLEASDPINHNLWIAECSTPPFRSLYKSTFGASTGYRWILPVREEMKLSSWDNLRRSSLERLDTYLIGIIVF
jgi:hypothetical protein